MLPWKLILTHIWHRNDLNNHKVYILHRSKSLSKDTNCISNTLYIFICIVKNSRACIKTRKIIEHSKGFLGGLGILMQSVPECTNILEWLWTRGWHYIIGAGLYNHCTQVYICKHLTSIRWSPGGCYCWVTPQETALLESQGGVPVNCLLWAEYHPTLLQAEKNNPKSILNLNLYIPVAIRQLDLSN